MFQTAVGSDDLSMRDPYTYKAVVTRVVDGDTIEADVDQGFGTWRHEQSFRLLGINAREHNAPGGMEAVQHLSQLLPVGTQLILTSVKPDKYTGRYDALITLPDGRDLAAYLIQDQWAAPWNGKGEKPLPPWPRS